MIKELVLVPRILYAALFTLIGLYAAFTSPMYPRSFIGAFLFVFLFSFVWQYFVLHFTLKTMSKNQRSIAIIVWFIISFAIAMWGVDTLQTLDWAQEISALTKDFAWRMTVYLIGVSMYTGGACTRRAYTKHNAL